MNFKEGDNVIWFKSVHMGSGGISYGLIDATVLKAPKKRARRIKIGYTYRGQAKESLVGIDNVEFPRMPIPV